MITPGGLLVYLIAKLQLKCFVYCIFTYTCYRADLYLEIWRLSVFRMCVKNVKVTPP